VGGYHHLNFQVGTGRTETLPAQLHPILLPKIGTEPVVLHSPPGTLGADSVKMLLSNGLCVGTWPVLSMTSAWPFVFCNA
jgi:hypothetical protein